MTAIVAFAIMVFAFALGDFVAQKTKGIISSFVVVIAFLLICGGGLGLIPGDIVALSGLGGIMTTFGQALLLTNLGSTLNVNEIIKEWKTVLVSLAGIVGIVLMALTVGAMFVGRDTAMLSIAPMTGGVVATMLTTDAANLAGRADLALFVSCIMGIQNLVGIPISSICLKKSAKLYIKNGNLDKAQEENNKTKEIDIRFIPKTSNLFNTPATHFCRVALTAAAAVYFAKFTGINVTLVYLIFGALAGATGIVERGSLRLARADGILLIAAYSNIAKSFAAISLAEFGNILPSVVGLLLLAAVGIALLSPIMGKLFKWDIYLSIATAISCMFGYPITYAIPEEITLAVKNEMNLSEEDAEKLQNHLMPKMVIAGVTSVSIASVIIAGLVIPMIF